MAGLRPGRCYRRIKRAYTRKSKYKNLAFIASVPPTKVVKFEYGDLQKEFNTEVNLVSKEAIQLRHNAIESARTVVIRHLDKLGGNYRLQIRAVPHHVLRENKMITGAGADRMQKGMALSFGRATGLAAQLKKGKVIFTIKLDKANIPAAKEAFVAATYRMCVDTEVQVKPLAKL